MSLSIVLNWQARYDEAIENFNAMLKSAEEIQDLNAQARALQGKGNSQMYLGDHQAAVDTAIQAETLARRADNKTVLARALSTQGLVRYRLGEIDMALSLAEKALAIFTDLNSESDIAQSLNLLGGIHYSSGKFDAAQRYWESALNLFREMGNRQLGMDLSNNLGVIAEARGDYRTAFQHYDSALTISREMGYRNGEILFLTNRGGAQVALKNYELAEIDVRQAIGMAGVTGSWVMPQAFNLHAEALLGLKRFEEAFYSARQGLVLAEDDKTPEDIGLAWRILGKICSQINDSVRFSDWETHQKGDYDAETCFSRSLQVLTDAEIDAERARTLREWALYEFQKGNKEAGEKKWNEAREIFFKLGAQMEVERMKSLPK